MNFFKLPLANQPLENVRTKWNTNARNISRGMNLFLKTFIMFGIDICRTKNNRKRKCILSTVRIAMILCWLCVFFNLTALLYAMISDKKQVKNRLAKIFLIIDSFSI